MHCFCLRGAAIDRIKPKKRLFFARLIRRRLRELYRRSSSARTKLTFTSLARSLAPSPSDRFSFFASFNRNVSIARKQMSRARSLARSVSSMMSTLHRNGTFIHLSSRDIHLCIFLLIYYRYPISPLSARTSIFIIHIFYIFAEIAIAFRLRRGATTPALQRGRRVPVGTPFLSAVSPHMLRTFPELRAGFWQVPLRTSLE